MKNDKIIKIVLISILIYILTCYFVYSGHENKIIKKIIMKKIDEDDTDALEHIKDKYLSEKFKIIITRSIVFSILLFTFIKLINKKTVIIKINKTNEGVVNIDTKSLIDIPF